MFSDIRGVNRENPKCKECNDTGVIETGNNDLPCEECPAGKTAVFNTAKGQQTGEEVLRDYNPPFNECRPRTWYEQ